MVNKRNKWVLTTRSTEALLLNLLYPSTDPSRLIRDSMKAHADFINLGSLMKEVSKQWPWAKWKMETYSATDSVLACYFSADKEEAEEFLKALREEEKKLIESVTSGAISLI